MSVLKSSKTKFIVIISILLWTFCYPIGTANSNTRNALILSIIDLSWEFRRHDENKATFLITLNVSIENTSSNNIELEFPNGCLFDIDIYARLENKSIEFRMAPEGCTQAIEILTFCPGTTNISDGLFIYLDSPSLRELPNGYYEIIFGKAQSRYRAEIADAARAYLYIYDGGYSISYNVKPENWVSLSFIPTLIAFTLVAVGVIIRRRNS